jgi:CheY-like chemotaxis protein
MPTPATPMLPMVPIPPMLPVRPEVPALRAPSECSVLLVGDTPSLRRLKRHLLEWAGYPVAEVQDGLEALERLRDSSTSLVVVMNTCIPRLDAAGILRTVAAEPKLQRHAVVLTTALSHMLPDELVPLTQQLQVQIISKPFTEQELLAAVATQAERLHAARIGTGQDETAPNQKEHARTGPAPGTR